MINDDTKKEYFDYISLRERLYIWERLKPIIMSEHSDDDIERCVLFDKSPLDEAKKSEGRRN